MNKRKIIFTIITVLLPVIFFVFVEFLFRSLNLFPQPPLFFEKNTFVKTNPNVAERYFNKKKIPVPNLYPQTFSAVKTDNTFRIFCLGGSSTAGFPYEMTVPFPEQLRLILQDDFPDRKFEVINLGLDAINSFTVLDWLPDILDHDPDLIIIYMGHNEFYGAYGTGSSISFGHKAGVVRFVMALQKLRIFQMLKVLIQSFENEPSADSNQTIMEKIIRDEFTAANPELWQITQNNFAENLDLILSECHEKNTPVILGNLACNLKDQPPLDAYNTQGKDSTIALKLYQKGWDKFIKGDSAAAYAFFSEARDNDLVPFRANSKINSIILEKAQKFNSGFVDMNSAFRIHSPKGIPGDNLFCDHLHPNPTGYKIMANEFHTAIFKTGIVPAKNVQQKYEIKPRLVTSLDWEIGSIRIYKLKHSWPFGNEAPDYDKYPPLVNDATARIAKDYLFNHHVWGRAHSEMAEYYEKTGKPEKACEEYQAVVEMYPDKTNYYIKLIDCAKSINAWSIVKKAGLKALTVSEVKGAFYFHLAMAERMMGNIKEAIIYIQKAIDSPETNREQLAEYFYTYATFLVYIRQFSGAKEILQDLIKQAPDYNPAKDLLIQLMK